MISTFFCLSVLSCTVAHGADPSDTAAPVETEPPVDPAEEEVVEAPAVMDPEEQVQATAYQAAVQVESQEVATQTLEVMEQAEISTENAQVEAEQLVELLRVAKAKKAEDSP